MVLTSLMFSSLLPASAEASPLPSAEALWNKLESINPGLTDYQVRLDIRVQAKYQFLNPRLNLKGTYYYKKPDRHKLTLDRASYFLNKYPDVFGWSLPDLKHFNSKVELTNLEGKEFYLVTLTPKTIAGDIERERLWIDKENYTFPKHVYEYKNQGVITLDVKYRKENNFYVFDKMNATFNIPQEKLSATANATYGQYQFNTGLTDSFFDD